MRITYDQNVDALHIRFKEATVTTKHLGEGIAGVGWSTSHNGSEKRGTR
jgi:hypothetical protein